MIYLIAESGSGCAASRCMVQNLQDWKGQGLRQNGAYVEGWWTYELFLKLIQFRKKLF